MKLSLIIPVYNEEETIRTACERLTAFLGENYEDYELIFVNDGSADSSEKIGKELEKAYPKVIFTGYPDNRGKGSAVRTGMLASTGDYCMFTDCDLAYGTDILKTLSDKLISSGADVVIGSRSIAEDGYEGYTPLRKTLSKCYLKLLSLITGFSHSDSQTGLKGFRGEVARELFSLCQINGFAFDLEVLMIAEKKKCKIEEIPAKIIHNRDRDSKVSPVKDGIKMMRDVMKIKKMTKNIDRK